MSEMYKLKPSNQLTNSFFFAAFDSIPVVSLVIDNHLNICLVNRSAAKFFCYMKSEFLSMKLKSLFSDQSEFARLQFQINSLKEEIQIKRVPPAIVTRVQNKAGAIIPVEIKISPVRSSDEVIFIIAINDISERLKTINHIKSQNERFQESKRGTMNLLRDLRQLTLDNSNTISLLEAIRESAGHGIISVSIDGTITSINSAAENMIGYSAQELIGEKKCTIFHDDDEMLERSEKFSSILKTSVTPGIKTLICLTERGLKNQFEWIYRHKNGTKFPIELTVTSLTDGDNKKNGYLCVVQNISLLKTTERKLRESNQELEKFAYTTSHDLKAPLRGIDNLITFLEEDLELFVANPKEGMDNVTEHFVRMKAQVKRMKNLIEGILNYSKIHMEENQLEEVNLESLVEDIVFELAIDERFKIIKNVQDLKINTEAIKLNQVISNIISNSVKYHHEPDKGIIKINSTVIGDYVEICIEDNGPGIAKKYHKKVFELFQTLQSKDKIESTGVGLALVEKILKSKSSQYSIDSDEGEGVKFTFTWPINENV